MTAAAIVQAVREAGAALRVDGQRILARPLAAVPDELRAALARHKAEVAAYLRAQRALPTDTPGECAWCGRALGDRDRLCGDCTADGYEPEPVKRQRRRPTRPAERRRVPTSPRCGKCPGCGGGLQPGDDALALCGTCLYTAKHLAPRRPQ